MKDKNWSYLAGIFDGEGYIGISINHRGPRDGRGATVEYQARIAVVNTSVKLMKWLVSFFGGVYYSRQKVEGWRLSYNWEPKGARNKEILLLGILPYLQIKKEQANLLLQFLRMENKSDRELRQKLYEQMRILNRTGDSVTTDTPSDSQEPKIQSELTGDSKSEPAKTQVQEVLDTYMEYVNFSPRSDPLA